MNQSQDLYSTQLYIQGDKAAAELAAEQFRTEVEVLTRQAISPSVTHTSTHTFTTHYAG